MLQEIRILGVVKGGAKVAQDNGTGEVQFTLSRAPDEAWKKQFEACRPIELEPVQFTSVSNNHYVRLTCAPSDLSRRFALLSEAFGATNQEISKAQAEASRVVAARHERMSATEKALNEELQKLSF